MTVPVSITVGKAHQSLNLILSLGIGDSDYSSCLFCWVIAFCRQLRTW